MGTFVSPGSTGSTGALPHGARLAAASEPAGASRGARARDEDAASVSATSSRRTFGAGLGVAFATTICCGPLVFSRFFTGGSGRDGVGAEAFLAKAAMLLDPALHFLGMTGILNARKCSEQ
eukprot:533175-Pyramimonas_sp.AAC.1